MQRWATFDCYGTLIDWNGGIRAELERLFGDDEDEIDGLLARYHELEPELERDGKLSYREVMTEAMQRLGAPAGRGGRARRLATGLGAVPGDDQCADRVPGARLEARDPLELRQGPDRGLEGADRRADRRDRRRLGDPLVQAESHALARVLRPHAGRQALPRPRRREQLPRHRARPRSSGSGASGSIGWRSMRSPLRRSRSRISTSSARCSTT